MVEENAYAALVRRRLAERAAADYLGLSVRTLQAWRRKGTGPEYLKMNGAIRYETDALDKFIAESRRTNTAEAGG